LLEKQYSLKHKPFNKTVISGTLENFQPVPEIANWKD